MLASLINEHQGIGNKYGKYYRFFFFLCCLYKSFVFHNYHQHQIRSAMALCTWSLILKQTSAKTWSKALALGRLLTLSCDTLPSKLSSCEMTMADILNKAEILAEKHLSMSYCTVSYVLKHLLQLQLHLYVGWVSTAIAGKLLEERK